jgi:hypothetical protein
MTLIFLQHPKKKFWDATVKNHVVLNYIVNALLDKLFATVHVTAQNVEIKKNILKKEKKLVKMP